MTKRDVRSSGIRDADTAGLSPNGEPAPANPGGRFACVTHVAGKSPVYRKIRRPLSRSLIRRSGAPLPAGFSAWVGGRAVEADNEVVVDPDRRRLTRDRPRRDRELRHRADGHRRPPAVAGGRRVPFDQRDAQRSGLRDGGRARGAPHSATTAVWLRMRVGVKGARTAIRLLSNPSVGSPPHGPVDPVPGAAPPPRADARLRRRSEGRRDRGPAAPAPGPAPPGRASLVSTDRSGVPRRDRWRSFLIAPQTLLRWHRELVRRKWTYRTAKFGRPRIDPELREFVLRPREPALGVRANPGRAPQAWHPHRIAPEIGRASCRERV